MILRLTSSSLAGTLRKLVAVGTPRLAVMFWTMRAAAPRRGSPASPAAGVGAAGAGVVAAGVVAAGVVAAGAGAAGAGAAPLTGLGAVAGAWGGEATGGDGSATSVLLLAGGGCWSTSRL